MTDESSRIDWAQAHARLDRARRALEAAGEPTPEEARRILAARAEALAAPPPEEASLAAPALELLVFSAGAERYGIETGHVLEVLRLPEITRVPCTPPFVLGVVNHRGRILAVLHVGRLAGTSDFGATGESRVIAVEAGGVALGLLAGAVEGELRVGAGEMTPPPPGPAGGGPALVRGVTAGMVGVLDLDTLVRDPRVVVDQEVG